jgi:ribonuclease HI
MPYESTHNRIGHMEQAYDKTAFDIIPKFINNCNEELTIYTNNNQLDTVLPPLPEKQIHSTVNVSVEDYYYNKRSHSEKWQSINELWRLASLIGFDDRYMCKPEKPPEPPYEVYTDASLWDEYETASVGFIVLGDNGGMYSAGFPTSDDVQDNNVAECYAILSALKSLPNNVEVEINTDSKYAFNQMTYIENESQNTVMDDIKKELERFENNPHVKQVSRELTFLPDLLAGACKDNPMIIGQNPRACVNL